MWRKIQKTLANFIPLILLVAFVVIAISLLNRWDSMVAVTLIPIWAWAGFGMAVSLICWLLCREIPPIVTFCLFLACGIAFSEETLTIMRELGVAIRGGNPGDAPAEKPFRVVNVNSAGSVEALKKAIDGQPDVVIIQEAPGESELEAVADQLYGVDRAVSRHKTSAIIARGVILGEIGDSESSTMHVRLKLADGMILDLTNLDLGELIPRFDIWRPSVWKELMETRISNRRLVRACLGENEITTVDIGRIVSGGFGTPPGDDVFRPLETSGLVDTFRAAGLGWGNTYPPDYPFLRLDQIWVSPNLKPLKSVSRLNSASPRRTVVCDLKLPGGK